jgi:hypothetical protein
VTARHLAWGLWGLAVLLVIPGPVLQTALEWQDETDLPFLFGFIAVQIGTASAGAVIAARLPRNPVGWSFLAMGVGMAIALSSSVYAELGVNSRHGPFPLDEASAWISHWVFLPVMFGVPLYLLFVYPTGAFLSPRWKWSCVVVMVLVGVATAILAFKPGPIGTLEIDNPLGIGGAVGESLDAVEEFVNALAVPGFMLAISALVVRLRRSRGVERQQVKLFTYVAAFVGIGLAGSALAPTGWPADVLFLIGLLALAGLPVAAGVAILRYRLYDIDLVIRRTLVYGALTATLIASYLAGVLLLQLALSPLTEDNGLAIAGSTLAAAALFRPARARIQAIVDRRFYRRRYDAAHTIETFGARLRDQVELDALSAELRDVVGDTMQPAHVSLWLRETA